MVVGVLICSAIYHVFSRICNGSPSFYTFHFHSAKAEPANPRIKEMSIEIKRLVDEHKRDKWRSHLEKCSFAQANHKKTIEHSEQNKPPSKTLTFQMIGNVRTSSTVNSHHTPLIRTSLRETL